MAVPHYVFAELVRESCTATGTGPLVLAGALPGHRRFVDAVTVGASFCYAVAGITDPAQWENGIGQIDAHGRLVRLTISASSAGGARVDFAAGLKSVALTVGANWFTAASVPPEIGEVTGLQAALNGKQAVGNYALSGHSHIVGDVTGLQAALDSRQPISTGHGSATMIDAADQITVRRGSGWVNVPGSAVLARDANGNVALGTGGAAAQARIDVQSSAGIWHQIRLSAGQPSSACFMGAVNMAVGSWMFDAAYYGTSLQWMPVHTVASGIRMVAGEVLLCGNSGLSVGTLYTPTTLLTAGVASVRPGADNVRSLGTAAARWTQLFAATGTIATSDRETKRDIEDTPDDWLDAWSGVNWRRFRFVDGRRWHTGLVAQEVSEAFGRRGLDATDIGLICIDEDGAGGRIWGLRYDECLAMEAAWQRRELARLDAAVRAPRRRRAASVKRDGNQPCAAVTDA